MPVVMRMVSEDVSSRMVGSAMAGIGRGFKQGLLELAEIYLGPPPVPYCFLALGSIAGHEQILVTDQDNALVLDNRYDPTLHNDYFEELAAFICDRLARCGYSYCSGGVMATNARWRQPLRVWESYFTQWIEEPTPETLLSSNIFFDLEGVWGKPEWAERLRNLIARKAKTNPRFLACMTRNALLRTPTIKLLQGICCGIRWPIQQSHRPQAPRHRAHGRPNSCVRDGGWIAGTQFV